MASGAPFKVVPAWMRPALVDVTLTRPVERAMKPGSVASGDVCRRRDVATIEPRATPPDPPLMETTVGLVRARYWLP